MPSNKIGKDELIELFKEMKLTQKKCDVGISIYENKYEKKEEKTKSKSFKADNIHKKPLRPYFIYQKDIMNEHKDRGENISRSEIGKMWKDLKNDEKLKYINKYNNELKLYNKRFNIPDKFEEN